MKLLNQVKILKASGLRFRRITSRCHGAVYNTPGGHGIIVVRSTTKAELIQLIQAAYEDDARSERYERNRRAHNRRKRFKAIDGERPWFQRPKPIAQLKLVA